MDSKNWKDTGFAQADQKIGKFQKFIA